ncbi:Maf-like protein [Alkalicaulis satelles]|uniref:Nucleoside triphosphate pyrophosphatase n=1 Tax=Alkalicaulis satelles TaxID=2609175 RepID=A0A5M6ZKT0_9PROT|nr:nucleoside triphosphate pyrophosphatase [Alkalicaulis satelles]KAA5803828.1 Maf-like protein [Alkalicaulis satelles]
MTLILASGSASRRAILSGAGVDFEVQASGVDEDALKRGFTGTPGALAQALADAKALAVSAQRPGLVIGADQVLEFDGRAYDKARDDDEALARLKLWRGRTHYLAGGLTAAREGQILWRHASRCALTMRPCSDAFLDYYGRQAGEILTSTVGGYAFEGLGAQLFEAVEGDYFAILGLPLLPLLSFLRTEGLIAT